MEHLPLIVYGFTTETINVSVSNNARASEDDGDGTCNEDAKGAAMAANQCQVEGLPNLLPPSIGGEPSASSLQVFKVRGSIVSGGV